MKPASRPNHRHPMKNRPAAAAAPTGVMVYLLALVDPDDDQAQPIVGGIYSTPENAAGAASRVTVRAGMAVQPFTLDQDMFPTMKVNEMVPAEPAGEPRVSTSRLIADLMRDRAAALSDSPAVRADWYDRKARVFEAVAGDRDELPTRQAEAREMAAKAREMAAEIRGAA